MLLLHLSDIHGHLPWYRHLHRLARHFDLVVITGDLLDREEDAPAVGEILATLPAPLAVCSGNHEGRLGTAWLPTAWHGDGAAFEFGGRRWRCLPWAEPLPADRGAGEIWLSHAPPSRSHVAVSRYGFDFGDDELGALCRRGRGPALVLCGHVHTPRHWQDRIGGTLALNPGSDRRAPLPPFNVVDLRRGIVTHHRNGHRREQTALFARGGFPWPPR
ncbi:MAG: hypothetical protein C0518_05050 [Opitutus sp.]|nr:hypothetical protein [Opitutus sp.]